MFQVERWATSPQTRESAKKPCGWSPTCDHIPSILSSESHACSSWMEFSQTCHCLALANCQRQFLVLWQRQKTFVDFEVNLMFLTVLRTECIWQIKGNSPIHKDKSLHRCRPSCWTPKFTFEWSRWSSPRLVLHPTSKKEVKSTLVELVPEKKHSPAHVHVPFLQDQMIFAKINWLSRKD